MKRVVLHALCAAIVISTVIVAATVRPAYSLPVGGPGFALDHEEKIFAVSGGAGYTYRLVEGDNFQGLDKQDVQESFRFLLRAEAAVLRWLTPMVVAGFADRTRSLINFEGTLSPLIGGGLRIDPIIQSRNTPVGIGIVAQVGYEPSSGRGLINDYDVFTGRQLEATINADTWHYEATVLISRKDGRVGLYAGPKFDYDRTIYSVRSEKVTPRLPVGIVVGVDYDVTPEVFFTAEMENFHQDALYGLVGARF